MATHRFTIEIESSEPASTAFQHIRHAVGSPSLKLTKIQWIPSPEMNTEPDLILVHPNLPVYLYYGQDVWTKRGRWGRVSRGATPKALKAREAIEIIHSNLLSPKRFTWTLAWD